MRTRDKVRVLYRAQEGGAFNHVWALQRPSLAAQPEVAKAIKDRIAEILGEPFEKTRVTFSFVVSSSSAPGRIDFDKSWAR